MINDEALVQTKSLSTQLSLATNQRNPGCLVIAGNTGNVVCNTTFTNLSDSRVKTEMAEADWGSSCSSSTPEAVQAPRHERKWKNLTEQMVTLDYSHLTSVLWGVCKGFQARLDEVEAWQAQRGPKNK